VVPLFYYFLCHVLAACSHSLIRHVDAPLMFSMGLLLNASQVHMNSLGVTTCPSSVSFRGSAAPAASLPV
jgi:hypothetical protein